MGQRVSVDIVLSGPEKAVGAGIDALWALKESLDAEDWGGVAFLQPDRPEIRGGEARFHYSTGSTALREDFSECVVAITSGRPGLRARCHHWSTDFPESWVVDHRDGKGDTAFVWRGMIDGESQRTVLRVMEGDLSNEAVADCARLVARAIEENDAYVIVAGATVLAEAPFGPRDHLGILAGLAGPMEDLQKFDWLELLLLDDFDRIAAVKALCERATLSLVAAEGKTTDRPRKIL